MTEMHPDTRIRSEKRRGFQPPWYTVRIYTCGVCKNETTLRVPVRGFGPGAVFCNCGALLKL
jgi:hypothetical protein